MLSTKARLQGYTITSERTEDSPSWGGPHRAYKVTITNPRGRRYTTPFCIGIGDGEPTVEDVLNDLLNSASTYDSTQSFEEWAGEMGYTWTTRARRRQVMGIYRHCERQSAKVRTFFTSEELERVIAELDI